jgi:hypothetical protein
MKDMEIIPELTKTISTNAPLKKIFDANYPGWKKQIAPDL